MSFKSRLRTVFVCMVLECGVLFGVNMPPEKIKALLDALNQPQLAHVLPSEDDEGDDPPSGPGGAILEPPVSKRLAPP